MEKKEDLFPKPSDKKLVDETAAEKKEAAKDAQVEGAKAKAGVIGSPSLAEQASQVERITPGWEKPGSDLQEPGKVEGAVFTKKDVREELKKRKPRYMAGHSEPVYIDEVKFEELGKKLDAIKKQYDGNEGNIPLDHEYWKLKKEQVEVLNAVTSNP